MFVNSLKWHSIHWRLNEIWILWMKLQSLHEMLMKCSSNNWSVKLAKCHPIKWNWIWNSNQNTHHNLWIIHLIFNSYLLHFKYCVSRYECSINNITLIGTNHIIGVHDYPIMNNEFRDLLEGHITQTSEAVHQQCTLQITYSHGSCWFMGSQCAISTRVAPA